MTMLVSCRSGVPADSDNVLALDGRVEHVDEYREVADCGGAPILANRSAFYICDCLLRRMI